MKNAWPLLPATVLAGCAALGTKEVLGSRPSYLEDVRQRVRAAGAGAAHEGCVRRRWTVALPQDGGRRLEGVVPRTGRFALADIGSQLRAH